MTVENVKNILIVDDEVATRLAVSYQLQALGEIEIHQACNLDDANRKMSQLQEEDRTLHHAVVHHAVVHHAVVHHAVVHHAVIDLRLAGSPDGFAVIAEIEKQFPQASVTILTVQNDREVAVKAGSFHSVRYLITKPWRSDQLVDAVQRSLSGEARGLTFIGDMEGEANDTQQK